MLKRSPNIGVQVQRSTDEGSEDTDSESAEDAIPTAELEIEGDFECVHRRFLGLSR